MKKLVVILLTSTIVGCGPSEKEKQVASMACREFVSTQMKVKEENTKVFDIWKKKNVIVVEVGYNENPYRSNSSYSVRKCIYDEKKGRISLPSLLNDGQWDK